MKDQVNHVQIELDSDHLVLRAGGSNENEPEPAVLSGKLLLKLLERTSVKDISLTFNGRARLAWVDGPPTYKTHSQEVPIFFHNFSFLPEHDVQHHSHSHTLNAGLHTFPFSLSIPPDLPASLRSYTGSALIDYRLKATVVRSGFVSTNWTAKKTVMIHRGLGPDSVEFNSTVEIENTWPNKIVYSFTLPHKAYAAGTEIPVSIRFTPLVKGVRVTSLSTEIRENLVITTKYGTQHSESHAIYTSKEDLTPGSHPLSRTASRTPSRGPSAPSSRPLSRVSSNSNLHGEAMRAPRSGNDSGSGTGSPHTGSYIPPSHTSNNGPGIAPMDLHRRLANVSMTPRAPALDDHSSTPPSRDGISEATGSGIHQSMSVSSAPVESWMNGLEAEPEFTPLNSDDVPPEEVHMVVKVPVPAFTAPSNSAPPATITHRIKWSCLIQNRDGHTSELRCALPLLLLDRSFQEEVRLATSGAHSLLFGPSGVLVPELEEQAQAELPSYQDHVLDRIAHPAVVSAAGFRPNPWAGASLLSSFHEDTPLQTPAPSRPPSPGAGGLRHASTGDDTGHNFSHASLSSYFHPQHTSVESDSSGVSAGHRRPTTPGSGSEEVSTPGGSSFFSLHIPKPRRAFAPLSRHSTHSERDRDHHSSNSARLSSLGSHLSLSSLGVGGGPSAPATPTEREDPIAHQGSGRVTTSNSPTDSVNPNLALGQGSTWNAVPPYDVATGWLATGIVPLDLVRELPGYSDQT